MQRFCHRSGVGVVAWRQAATVDATGTLAPRDNHRRMVTRGRHARVAAGYTAAGPSSVTADLAAVYSIGGTTSADAAASYAVRAIVSADSAASYNVQAAVALDLAAAYSILSAGAVQADMVASYAVRAAVAASFTVSYGVGGAALSLVPGKRIVLSNISIRTVLP